jgi:signal transduction histidine kinase
MRWRLALVLVGFTLMVLLVQNIPLSSYLRTVENERLVAQLQRDAFTLSGYSVAALSVPNPGQTEDLSAVVAEYAKAPKAARVVVVDRAGTAIASSENRVGESYSNRQEITDAISTGKGVSGVRPSETLGEPLLYVAVPVRSGSQILGAVRLTFPQSEVDAKVNESVRSLFLAALITLLTAAVVALIVATTVTRRVRRLRDAAERIADGDLDARAEVSGGGVPEIQELAESFNTMADRVQAVVESQRGFAGDASHQLRTPLSALRLRLDRAADLMPDDDPAIDQVDAARDEIDRLQRLIDGLLVLARADKRDQQTVPVDVSKFAADRVEAWQPLADERSVTIELDAPGMAIAQVVPSAIEQIIDNYVDNALEVVPEGSRIVVSVRSEPGGVLLMVDDQGPGLPREDRERAFDRFWRGTQDGNGSGLGLAVVSSLVTASGGSVWLDASPLGGLRAVARLRAVTPVAPVREREGGGRHS